ncbi:MAG: hypothetical protein HEP70_05090 [Rhodobiaceae bacterium]|nr:hypothetical protein [Rhodobiaceae bacterium]
MKTLRSKKTGHKPDGTLPLINIVLLLVLAFMMAGTFAEPLPPEFSPLRSGDALSREDPLEPAILTMDAKGTFSHEGLALADDAVDGFLNTLGRDDRVLEVRADARSPAVQVIRLLRSAESADIRDVQIVTLGRK